MRIVVGTLVVSFLCVFMASLTRAESPTERGTQALAMTQWTVFAVPSSSWSASTFISLPAVPQPDGSVGYVPTGTSWELPFGLSRTTTGGVELTFRPQADRLTRLNAGDLVARWSSTAEGTFRIRVSVRNIGLDVFGGDGGSVAVAHRVGEEGEATTLMNMAVGPSQKEPADPTVREAPLKLARGDLVEIRVNAGMDGYADRFQVSVAIEPEPASATAPSTKRAEVVPTPEVARAPQPPSPSVPLPPEKDWEVLAAPAGVIDPARYVPLSLMNAGGVVMAAPADKPYQLPFAVYQPDGPVSDGSETWECRVDRDSATKIGCGDLVLRRRIAESGNYRVEIKARNLGLDVFGGDGGVLTVTRFESGQSDLDNANVLTLALPLSKLRGSDDVSGQAVVALTGGDEISLRVNANVDGYADRFRIALTVKPVTEAGQTVRSTGYDGYISSPPAVARPAGVPLRPGLVWIGTDGNWANSAFAEPAYRLIRRYVPDVAAVMIHGYPERVEQPQFYRRDNIPTLIQWWGAAYEPYLRHHDAMEYAWNGEVYGRADQTYPASSSHSAAMPHPHTRRAFSRLIDSAVTSGFSGYGFCDMVWLWAAGRGAAGHNPETVRAFRLDLEGADEGFTADLDGKGARRFQFADYVRHYFGDMPSARSFGLDRWSDFHPIRYRQRVDSSVELGRQLLLFDLLCHYEWIKFADFLGRQAAAKGGVFQCMPNPEDLSNGVDQLFLNALVNVHATSEEYFNHPRFLDAAFSRHLTMRRINRSPRQAGIVLESGSGGNEWPYYSNELAYAVAYEASSATQADHVEADFWPGAQIPLEEMLKVQVFQRRAQQVMAYGMGATDAKRDGLIRRPARFVSVNSRHIFRPWGTVWFPWAWNLATTGCPDQILRATGYNFDSVGEDVVQLLGNTPESDLIVYSPTISTASAWRCLMARLADQRTTLVIASAHSLEKTCREDLAIVPFKLVFPEIAVTRADDSLSGPLVDAASGKPLSDQVWKVEGRVFELAGSLPLLTIDGRPLVVATATKGLMVLLFDPSIPANNDLAQLVYGHLLSGHKVHPESTSPLGVTVRVYERNDLTLVSALDVTADDWSKVIASGLPPDQRFVPTRSGRPAFNIALLKMAPSTRYEYLSFPSSTRAFATSDLEGKLELKCDGNSLEHLFVVPASPASGARLDDIARRRGKFDEAMLLRP